MPIPRRYSDPALALVLGLLAIAGFAPFSLFPLPVLTLALLFRLWERARSRRGAALTGLLFGVGFFGAGVSWVYVSIHDFGGMPALLAVAATVLFCLFLALFPAAVGFLQAWAGGAAWRRHLLVIPALWVVSEWVRGWILTGFPWLAVGYSQVPAGPLAGFAPALGAYGVSLAVAVSSGLLALMAGSGRRKASTLALALVLLWLGGLALKQVSWTLPEGPPVTVSLVQGNIPQELKWREDKARGTLETYEKMTLASPGRLIVLPETALPLFLHQVPVAYLERLARHVQGRGGDVLVGVPEYAEGGRYYNSVLSVGASRVQIYRKHHLVPFGEYIPLKPVFGWIVRVLHIPLSDFSRGEKVQPPLEVAGQRAAVAVCYEDVFGEELIRQLPQATLLVNVSNDAWFGDSIAPWQHLQISQMRALETGRYMLRATNTGITAIVNERGEVARMAPEFQAFRLDGAAQGYAGATPYVRWGNGGVLLLLAGMLAVAAWSGRRRE